MMFECLDEPRVVESVSNANRYPDVWVEFVRRGAKTLSNSKTFSDSTCAAVIRASCKLRFPSKKMLENSCLESLEADLPKLSTLRKLYQEFVVVLMGLSSRASSCDENSSILLINYLARKVINHIPNPLLLSNFFIGCFNHRNPRVALESLEPILSLMTLNNLGDTAVSNVFERLYVLLDTENLNKCTSRSAILVLISRLLESSLVPTLWVAAFVKKFARLAVLSGDSSLIVWMVSMIYSLSQRFPSSCKALFHREDETMSGLVGDPFRLETPLREIADNVLSKTSLWEIELLARHANPSVSGLASLLKTNIFSSNAKILLPSEVALMTENDLMEKEKKFAKNKRKIEVAIFDESDDKAKRLRDLVMSVF